MTKEILETLRKEIEEIITKDGFVIYHFSYSKKGRDNYLAVYLDHEDDSPITMDDLCVESDKISDKLDELDLIEENYNLQVSSAGAEKEIKDLTKLDKYVGKYILVKLRNPVEGLNSYLGDLVEVNDTSITLEYKVKTRIKHVVLNRDNITKINLQVKF